MIRPGLKEFLGKVLPSTSLTEFYSSLEEEFNDADSERYRELAKNGKPLPFTGLFANTITSEKVTASEGGGFLTEKVQSLDVFGLIYKTPVVMRIDGWKPSFMVLVPIGVDAGAFKREILSLALHRVGSMRCEVVSMPEFESFQCGIDRQYIKIYANTSFNAQTIAKAAISAFQQCWSDVDSATKGYEVEAEGCRALTEPRDIELHQREKIHYPLRYTGTLGENDMPYHFMTQEDIPLIGHLTINKYKLFDPRESSIRYKHGIRVEWPSATPSTTSSTTSTKRTIVEQSVEAKVIERRTPSSPEENFAREALCCSYDIETALSRVQGHKFSDPRVPDDSIMTIGMPIYRISKNLPEISIALLPKDHPALPLDKSVIITCEDEKDIIHIFSQIMRRFHIPILTGYNIDEFDNRYMYLRAQLLGVNDEFIDAFSEYDLPGKSVFKDNEKFKMDNIIRENLHRPYSTQRSTIDAFLRLVKMRPKEFQEGAGLNKMLAWFGVKDPETKEDAHKMDMPIAHMYDLWAENKPEGIREIVKYCVIDARTTYLLLYWINFFTDMFELSNISYTTLLDSFHRADGKRVSQLLMRYARANKVAFCSELPPKEYRPHAVDGKIDGGDVKSLSPGLQYFIISLDYKSEYPAQKEAFNIGSSSKVPEELIKNPKAFGLVELYHDDIVDQYCSSDPHWRTRERYCLALPSGLKKFEEILAENASASAAASTSSLDSDTTRDSASEKSKDEKSKDEKKEAIKRKVLRKGINEGWIFEIQQFWAEATDGGKELQWKTYFVQSPRGDNGKIIHHYSIQAMMLTDLRFERDKMKARASACVKEIKSLEEEMKKIMPMKEESKGQEEARLSLLSKIAKLKADKTTFDSRQNAVKILMNSEYGTGNNDRYPHFDQDVAATVTWCSRRLAEFLRRILTCSEIILPDYIVTPQFLTLLNEGYAKDKGLTKFGFELTEYAGPLFTDSSSIGRSSVSSSSTESSAVEEEEEQSVRPAKDAWKHPDGSVIIDPSLITERRVVKKWYTLRCAPSTLTYQDTDSNYYRVMRIIEHFSTCPDPVARAKAVMHNLLDHNDLYALLVEGLVNRWPVAVSCDGGFISAYWSPMKKQYMGTKAPTTHADIEKIDESLLFPKLRDRREDEAVAQFLDRKKIKVTGYLIIRRETPDYVIDLLFTLLENLLCLRENANALVIARDIMEKCEKMIRGATSVNAKMFSKQQKYRPYTNNEVKSIVARLRQEDKHDLIPIEFSVARYVLISDVNMGTEEFYARGKVPKGRKIDRMRLLTELTATAASESTSTTSKQLSLDVPYYLDKMAKALANLVFEELISEEKGKTTDQAAASRLDRILTDYQESHSVETKEDKAMAKKAIKEAVAILMRRHYTVPGTVKVHSQQFKKASELLSGMTVSTSTSQRAVKQALTVSFDRTTSVGELAATIIKTELKLALLRRNALNERAYCYANFLFEMKTESDRKTYISNRLERLSGEFLSAQREMVRAYADLIKAIQKIDPLLSREILRHRNDGTDITVESLAGAIPVERRAELAKELIALDRRVEPFRATFLEKRALERGLEILNEYKQPVLSTVEGKRM
jgi:DNA polymerase elongation subunit (family B)